MLKQSVRSFNFSFMGCASTIGFLFRGEAMETLLKTAAVTPAAWNRRGPLRWLQSARRAWLAMRRRAADRRALQAMSEAELRDMGIGRGEADHLTRPCDRLHRPW